MNTPSSLRAPPEKNWWLCLPSSHGDSPHRAAAPGRRLVGQHGASFLRLGMIVDQPPQRPGDRNRGSFPFWAVDFFQAQVFDAINPTGREDVQRSEPQVLGDDVALHVVGAREEDAPHAVADIALQAPLDSVTRGAEDTNRVQAVLDEALRNV